jgi:hypothetical protein
MVVDEVANRDDTLGTSTVTAAVVNAVVLPKASTMAVTATTTSASEFVVTMSVNAAVPWRLRMRSCSSALGTDLVWISRCISSTWCGDGRA